MSRRERPSPVAGSTNPRGVRVGMPAREAVTLLAAQQAAKIRALALRAGLSRDDADDAVQEVFLLAFRRWETFRGDAEPTTWLYAIAVRVCRRRLRKTATRAAKIGSIEELAPFEDRSIADLRPGNRGGTPLTEQLDAEAIGALRAAIVELPEGFRLAIVLKEVLEFSTEEVAAVLGVRPQTVKTRVHRARLRLRAALMRHVAQRPAPTPMYERYVCLDLLKAKLDALDHGRNFAMRQEVVCERCRAVFAELEFTSKACVELAKEESSAAYLRKILSALEQAAGQSGSAGRGNTPHGRKNVRQGRANREPARRTRTPKM
jgi:RNA polymerase sigma-70 factor, ECF subfamily